MNKHSIANAFYRMLIALSLLAIILGSLPSITVQAVAIIRHVVPSGKTTGTCDSWSNACELQYALDIAVSGDELWVIQGTYKPTSGSSRAATFRLITGIKIYGGFNGTETNREERNWISHKTILSGDIGKEGDNSDNSYAVVTSSGTDSTTVVDGFTITGGKANGGINNGNGGGMYNVDGSLRIENIIFDGNSASFHGGGMFNSKDISSCGPSFKNVKFINNSSGYYGGGLFIKYCSHASLTNVIFKNNTTGYYGGGLHSNFSNINLTNVLFDGNVSGDLGGGMIAADYSFVTGENGIADGNSAINLGNRGFIDLYDINLLNVVFIGNSAGQYGGGMYNNNTNPNLVNVTFNRNSAEQSGGGIYNENSSPSIHNNILWGNNPEQVFNNNISTPTITYSDIQGGCPLGGVCTHVINTDPLFRDSTTGNLHLSGTSPAIDAGDNSRLPPGTLSDVAGNPRFIDISEIPDTGFGSAPIVDMGAYERQSDSTPLANNDSYTTNEDTQLTVAAPGVLGNDSDPNGDPLTAIQFSDPAHGTLNHSTDGSFIYTPALNFNGSDSFTYRAYDGSMNSNIVTVTITITPVNDAPVAFNDSYSTDEDTILIVDAPGVLGNDTDVDSVTLTTLLENGPLHGELTLSTNGSFVYTPDPGYTGLDKFTYLANDGGLNSNIATVTITIGAPFNMLFLPIIIR